MSTQLCTPHLHAHAALLKTETEVQSDEKKCACSQLIMTSIMLHAPCDTLHIPPLDFLPRSLLQGGQGHHHHLHKYTHDPHANPPSDWNHRTQTNIEIARENKASLYQ